MKLVWALVYIVFQASLCFSVRLYLKTPKPINQTNQTTEDRGMTQLVEGFPSMHKALDMITNTT